MKESLGYKLSRNYFGGKGTRKRTVTSLGIALNISVILTLVAGIDLLHTQSLQLFFFLFPLAIISFLMGRRVKGHFTVKRHFQGQPTAGESYYYDLVIRREGGKTEHDLILKEWIKPELPTQEMVESIPEPGEENRNRWDRFVRYYRWGWLMRMLDFGESRPREIKILHPNQEQIIRMKLIPKRRGIFKLSGISLALPDPFNFYQLIRYLPAKESLLVWPKRYQVRFDQLFSGGGQTGYYDFYDQIGEGDLFWGIRPYRPGDPLKKIHWKSWAKTGKPIVKEFQQESNLSCSIVLDTTTSIEDYFHVEELITLAASIAETIDQKKIPLNQFWINEQQMILDGSSLREIFTALAEYQFNPGQNLEQIAATLSDGDERMGMIFWVTVRWSGEREQILRGLKGRGLGVRVFVLQGTPPDGGVTVDPKLFYGAQYQPDQGGHL